MKKTAIAAALALVLAAQSGCATFGTGIATHDNSKRLMARPDSEAAYYAAPGFVADAIATINALEYELERK